MREASSSAPPLMEFIVHTDMHIDLNFDVGKHKVRVKLDFKAGDDAEVVLGEFIRCERVPIYLEGNILCAVHALLQQERSSWQCTDYGRPECEENVQGWIENFQQQHKRQVWDGSMSMEADGIGELDEEKAKDAAFASKFHALVTSSPSALEKVLDLERQYTVALGHTVAAQDEVLPWTPHSGGGGRLTRPIYPCVGRRDRRCSNAMAAKWTPQGSTATATMWRASR